MSDKSRGVSGASSALDAMRRAWGEETPPFRVVTVGTPGSSPVKRETSPSEFVSPQTSAAKVTPKASEATQIDSFLVLTEGGEASGQALAELIQRKINQMSWKGPRPQVTSAFAHDADTGVRAHFKTQVKIRVSPQDSATLQSVLFESADD